MGTTKWIIDHAHSEVSFKVKHLVISTVTGYFRKFVGSAESTSNDFDGATVSFSVDIESIDTNQSDRDGHLKSQDFFDAANHPKLTFAGTVRITAATSDGLKTSASVEPKKKLNLISWE